MSAALNHLHLKVRDVARSRAFYAGLFGFRDHVRHGDVLFMRDAADFDLALAPAAKVEPLPEGFHFGFRLKGRHAVLALLDRAASHGAGIAAPLVDEPDFVSFRLRDPDGYLIEVYWE